MDENRSPGWLEDVEIVRRTFKDRFGHEPDLDNPQTFNEKIAYKILFDRRPLLTLVADKIRVRDYVKQRVGDACLTRLYQTCRTPQEIDWSALPRRFIVKASHGSGMTAIVHDKEEVDRGALFRTLEGWLHTNYYYACRREWAYRDITPTLMLEELLTDKRGHVPVDFKFFVFDGRATYLQIDLDRFSQHTRTLYNRDLQRLDVKFHYPTYEGQFDFPANIAEMFELASRLASGFDFIRVDLYNVAGRIFFGELTNYPEEGRGVFDPPEYDAIFGAQWRLPARY